MLTNGSENSGAPNIRSVRKRIRVATRDAAFIYAILEACEGITSYSTLDAEKGAASRDLELRIPIAFVDEVTDVLKSIGESLGDQIYDYGTQEFWP